MKSRRCIAGSLILYAEDLLHLRTEGVAPGFELLDYRDQRPAGVGDGIFRMGRKFRVDLFPDGPVFFELFQLLVDYARIGIRKQPV